MSEHRKTAETIAAYAHESFTGCLSGREAEARVTNKIEKALAAIAQPPSTIQEGGEAVAWRWRASRKHGAYYSGWAWKYSETEPELPANLPRDHFEIESLRSSPATRLGIDGRHFEAMSILRDFKENGWMFAYEPRSQFVGASHPEGGKQSVLEMKWPYVDKSRTAIGHLIADMLNLKRPSVSGKDDCNDRSLRSLADGAAKSAPASRLGGES